MLALVQVALDIETGPFSKPTRDYTYAQVLSKSQDNTQSRP